FYFFFFLKFIHSLCSLIVLYQFLTTRVFYYHFYKLDYLLAPLYIHLSILQYLSIYPIKKSLDMAALLMSYDNVVNRNLGEHLNNLQINLLSQLTDNMSFQNNFANHSICT